MRTGETLVSNPALPYVPRMTDRKRGILLGILALALFLMTSGGRLYVNDSHIKLQSARALVQQGTLAIPSFGQLTFVSPKDSRSYAKFEPLHSLLFVPACAVARYAVSAGWVEPASQVYLEGALASMVSPLLAAIAIAIFFFWLRELGLGARTSQAGALLFASATILWPYTKRSWTEVPQMAALLAAVWLVTRFTRTGRPRDILLAGFLAGVVASFRVTGVVALPWLPLYLLVRMRQGRVGALARMAAGFTIAFFLLSLSFNWWRFGSLFDVYRWRTGGFTTPFFEGLWGLIASPGESVFLYSPVLILALFGMRKLERAHRGGALLAVGIPASLLCLYASWWFHAYTWGPRFLIPAIPFLLAPAMFRLEAMKGKTRFFARGLIVVSVGVQVLGVLWHLGGLTELSRPLHEAGLLSVDRTVTREETWHDWRRTRLTAHAMAAVQSIAPRAGRSHDYPLDLWPAQAHAFFGFPITLAWSIEAALLCGLVLLFYVLRFKESEE
ncbi:MAG: hypothetical protein HKN20_08945 [Gemmatimonadetes bacterium]|nr:hypothetical protein [Gemmatimonadota bacterium]